MTKVDAELAAERTTHAVRLKERDHTLASLREELCVAKDEAAARAKDCENADREREAACEAHRFSWRRSNFQGSFFGCVKEKNQTN